MSRLFIAAFCGLFLTTFTFGQIPRNADNLLPKPPVPYSVPILRVSESALELSVARYEIAADKKQHYILEQPDIISVEAIRLMPKDSDNFHVESLRQIVGLHAIGPDGFITLGSFGRVYINELTLEEARAIIEFHLSRFFEEPQVEVDIFASNSKVYYVTFRTAGLPDQFVKFPWTGNEMVQDALKNVQVCQKLSDRIWVARSYDPVILPVGWTADGKPEPNYELLPGDRVLVFMVENLHSASLEERRFTPLRSRILSRPRIASGGRIATWR